MDILNQSWTAWALCSTLLLLALYKLGTWNYDFFRARGIKTLKTVPFFGSIAAPTLKLRAFAYLIEDTCKNFKGERIVGLFQFHKRVLVVKDPELIKRITVKDFEHFTDHVQFFQEKSDSLFAKNLFFLKGEKWREMRTTLSPAFTSSKMKAMFVFINECGQQLGDYLQNEINKQEPGKTYVLDIKDLFTRFTNDVIATSAFGIHIDSLKEKDNHFYRMGKEITNFGGMKFLKFIGFSVAPKLLQIFGITFFSKREIQFFADMVHQTVSTREKEGIVRPDMIQLLILARRGELKAEVEEEEAIFNAELKAKKARLTLDDIAAQAIIFFFAGFETSSTLLAFASILLAMHEDEQKKLQDELDEILGDDRKVTYEKVQKMKYLDMILSEALRLYPPNMSTDRLCTKTYTIPESGNQPAYTVQQGDHILIPVYGIHRDPDYFPDPEKFDPERFSDENKANIIPYTYLPFGVGPRLCIGQRFALLEVKLALIHILSRFTLTVVDKTPLPLKLNPKTFNMGVVGGFWLGAKPRQNVGT